MTYLDYINHFWQVNEVHRLRPTAIALYFYILKVANARFWIGPYGISNRRLCGEFDVDEKTIQRARNELKQAALIDFVLGKRDRTATEYRLLTPDDYRKISGSRAGSDASSHAGSDASSQGDNRGKEEDISPQQRARAPDLNSREIPDRDAAIAQARERIGVDPGFAGYVFDDWALRGGKDASNNPVPILGYIAKRWRREEPEWIAGTHRGRKLVNGQHQKKKKEFQL